MTITIAGLETTKTDFGWRYFTKSYLHDALSRCVLCNHITVGLSISISEDRHFTTVGNHFKEALKMFSNKYYVAQQQGTQ